MPTMRAARMHNIGEPMSIDDVPVPKPRSRDVLVKVSACGIVPNLKWVLSEMSTYPYLSLPPLPAIFGLDPVGVIVEKGEQVHGFEIGDRVYVNPARYCGGCAACLADDTTSCGTFAFNGYFGSTRGAAIHYEEYPYGGLAEYMTAPQYSLVRVPDNVSDEMAARWGYMGTGYSALRKANVRPGTTVLINGISGTLGLPTAMLALAMGASKVLGTGRNRDLLEDVRAMAPDRIEVHSADSEETVADWARGLTGGLGVDVAVDAMFTGTPAEPLLKALDAVRRGGIHVNVGGVMDTVPLSMSNLMLANITLIGNMWFTTRHAQEMANILGSGTVDLSRFEHEIFPLEKINDALELFENRHGGFSNYVVSPAAV